MLNESIVRKSYLLCGSRGHKQGHSEFHDPEDPVILFVCLFVCLFLCRCTYYLTAKWHNSTTPKNK